MATKINKHQLQACSKPGLRAAVVNEAINSGCDDFAWWFESLHQHGCKSGMVSSLIYTSDIADFYDENKKEIEDLITESMKQLGHTTRQQFIDSMGDYDEEKSMLVWFAFEETARRIAVVPGMTFPPKTNS